MSIVTIRVCILNLFLYIARNLSWPLDRMWNLSTIRHDFQMSIAFASCSNASRLSKMVGQIRLLHDYTQQYHSFCYFPDLEWKLIYVSSPGNEELDQELDDCLVGPVPVGVNSFEFEGSAPDPSKIPPEDVLGVAALILTGSYRDQEFVRVGYYQNTEYDNEEMKETPPSKIMVERLVRDISTKPRVTRFQIKW